MSDGIQCMMDISVATLYWMYTQRNVKAYSSNSYLSRCQQFVSEANSEIFTDGQDIFCETCDSVATNQSQSHHSLGMRGTLIFNTPTPHSKENRNSGGHALKFENL